ncbi:MAG TPA: hypothetical protein VGF69_23005 [Thermoanaerobaculia bacterium]
MKVRLILVCTLLLLAAVPSFANNTNCRECDPVTNRCYYSGDATRRCLFDISSGTCYLDPFLYCNPTLTATVASEWKVTSVEISRPSSDAVTVTAPAAAAQPEATRAETVEQK